jgi:RHS repeat-associated protein
VIQCRWTSDLTTDVDFFDLDITYDRNSNITRVEDNVHAGFDWSYEMDNLDRLDRAERGTWNGSAITTQKEDQTWTLDQVGNWDQVTLDFNADDVYTGTDEYNDDRTHNTVNELTGRDTDDNGTDNYTLVYDAVGNLTDDGESYEYVYDPFGRLRKINNQSAALVAEYKYNALGHMIAVHEDTDTDGDVDANDKWFYPVHDERWRMIANFRESDTAPKEEWVNQDAGLDGRGGSSYINGVVLRNKDANTAWTSASDGNLEERIYFCQNWRGDVSALVYANGDQVEQVRYSPYGTPFGLPGGDTDSDGDCDATDVTQIQTWITASAYDVRGDVELDGDVDGADESLAQASYQGFTLGRGQLGSFGNRQGWAGYSKAAPAGWYEARNRSISASLGKWSSRDPLLYVGTRIHGRPPYPLEINLYRYVHSNPVAAFDPWGLHDLLPGGDLPTEESTGDRASSWWKVWGAGYLSCCKAHYDQEVAKNPEAEPLGATVCCGGQVITCVYSHATSDSSPGEVGADKIVMQCIGKHEAKHAVGASCVKDSKPWGQLSGDPPGALSYASEAADNAAAMAADKASAECLLGHLLAGSCLGDSDCQEILWDTLSQHPFHGEDGSK